MSSHMSCLECNLIFDSLDEKVDHLLSSKHLKITTYGQPHYVEVSDDEQDHVTVDSQCSILSSSSQSIKVHKVTKISGSVQQTTSCSDAPDDSSVTDADINEQNAVRQPQELRNGLIKKKVTSIRSGTSSHTVEEDVTLSDDVACRDTAESSSILCGNKSTKNTNRKSTELTDSLDDVSKNCIIIEPEVLKSPQEEYKNDNDNGDVALDTSGDENSMSRRKGRSNKSACDSETGDRMSSVGCTSTDNELFVEILGTRSISLEEYNDIYLDTSESDKSQDVGGSKPKYRKKDIDEQDDCSVSSEMTLNRCWSEDENLALPDLNDSHSTVAYSEGEEEERKRTLWKNLEPPPHCNEKDDWSNIPSNILKDGMSGSRPLNRPYLSNIYSNGVILSNDMSSWSVVEQPCPRMDKPDLLRTSLHGSVINDDMFACNAAEQPICNMPMLTRPNY